MLIDLHTSFQRVQAATVVLFLICTTGCTPLDLAVGGGATTGVAASQDRGIGGAIDDTKILTQINAELAHKDSNIFIALTLSVYEGRVMMTGVLKKQEDVDFAVKTAWGADGVKEVINEIVVDPTGRTGSFASDTFIVTQLRTNLLLDKDVSAVNYSVDAVRGVVYIMGVAQSQNELDRVVGYARNIRYVDRVVNHAILKDDPRRQPQESAQQGSDK
jgi:osmotically-inducible protein OsmY